MEQNIKILPPEEAKKIAAGEVVDRPAALTREFLDNAIDAGGQLVEVIIEEGGIRLTEVVDDGIGMGKEDLELCWLTHATSKIRSMDDLRTTNTLGFRGEALAAAAAVSALEILSSKDGREAWKLSVGPGEKKPPLLEQCRRTRGSSVRAIGLYDTIPARKRFLKRPGSEATACRQIFNEKALAFPNIAFRFTQDGILKTFIPAVSSLRERFGQVFLDESETTFLHEIAAAGNWFSVSIVAGGPELSRQDRRLQFVFANSRRIQDYSLIQALEYGLQGWFPNGTHPIGAVFVTIDPALADFNIHPAKREARFADPGAIHHVVSTALRDFCRRHNMIQNSSRSERNEKEGAELYTHTNYPSRGAELYTPQKAADTIASRAAMEALLSDPPSFAPLPGRGADFAAEAPPAYAPSVESNGIRYLGRLFELFILIVKNDRFFIIDQHAAHERILYERFLKNPIPKQELLVAIPFNTESAEDDNFLEEKKEELAKLGIVISRGENEWLIEALPAGWKLSDRKTVEEILSLRTADENLAERWAATTACHTAVRDGDYIDGKAAIALAEEAFNLASPRCPHGRPIWFELSQNDLLKAVKRT